MGVKEGEKFLLGGLWLIEESGDEKGHSGELERVHVRWSCMDRMLWGASVAQAYTVSHQFANPLLLIW